MNKKMNALLIAVILLFSTGCQSQTTATLSATPKKITSSDTTEIITSVPPETPLKLENNVLVAYFSATGNTKQIAGLIAEETGADLYQITPETPYTTADLNYGDSSSRATTEKNDPSARPSISGIVESIESYDIVYLGYPSWWGQSPKIISTFLESYDFSGKTIVPFCTSSSSGIGSSDTNLHSLCADTVNWMPGERFTATTSKDTVKKWIDSLDIQTSNLQNIGVFNFENKTVLLNSGYRMPILGRVLMAFQRRNALILLPHC